MVIESRDRFDVTVPLDQARQRVLAALVSDGARLHTQSEVHVEVRTGSTVRLRLLGLVGTKGAQLPMETRVIFEPNDDVLTVTTLMADRGGPGVRTGLHGRYDERFQQVAARVRASLDVDAPPLLG